MHRNWLETRTWGVQVLGGDVAGLKRCVDTSQLDSDLGGSRPPVVPPWLLGADASAGVGAVEGVEGCAMQRPTEALSEREVLAAAPRLAPATRGADPAHSTSDHSTSQHS